MEGRDALGTLMRRCELVVVSPLSRAMETAAGMFGAVEGGGEVLLGCCWCLFCWLVFGCGGMEGGAGLSLFLALELVREQIGGNPCDRRRTIAEYREEFPGIDFSLVTEDADVLWKPGKENRETEHALRRRCREFLNWCFDRPEDSIIVVTHSAFMCNLMVEYGFGGHEPCDIVKEHLYPWPKNCECRPLCIVDTRPQQLAHSPFYHAGGDPDDREHED